MKKLTLLLVSLFLLMGLKNTNAQDYALSFSGDDQVSIDAATWRDAGYALDFNGSNFSARSHDGMNLSVSDLTLETWVYVDNFNDPLTYDGISQIMGVHDVNGNASLRFDDDGNGNYKLQFVAKISNNNVVTEHILTSTESFNTGEWYHVAGTFNGSSTDPNYLSKMRIYINGVEDGVSPSEIAGTIHANSYFRLACLDGQRYLDGKLDESRVWTKARSVTEINRAMYNQLATNDRVNLQAYYQMSDGTGTTLTDNSVNSHVIDLVNQSWISSTAPLGRINNVTMEAWVYLETTSEKGCFLHMGLNDWGYGIGVGTSPNYESTGNELILLSDGVRWILTGHNIGTGWHHIAMIIDAECDFIAYLDGAEVYTESGTTSIPWGLGALPHAYIGGTEGVRYLTSGKIDDVRFWKEARTQTLIQGNMNTTLSGDESNLLAYYRMSDGSGTTLTDNSVNNQNGTISGAGYWYTLTASDTRPPWGIGNSGDPYQVGSLSNLAWISADNSTWASYFTQLNDIDASGTSSWNSGAGFSPIGISSTAFSGNYNGNHHVISGLTINRGSTDEVGMFGNVDWATIFNTHLTDANIVGHNYSGGLVGNAWDITLNDCSFGGSVSGSGLYAGGLIGWTNGSDVNNNIINNCYSTGTVSCSSNYVGGLIGAATKSTTKNCYTTVDVTRTGGSDIEFGAFAGSANNSIVENCYAIGDVNYAGGSPTDKGFMGSYTSSSFNDNFFDSDASNQSTADGATAKTTNEMMNQATFTNWDFTATGANAGTGIWIMAGYPHLQNEWTTTIKDIIDLQLVRLDLDQSYKQNNNIDATATSTWNYNGTDYDGFTPIGNATAQFSGSYNGYSHVVSNLTINRASTYYVGLFGSVTNSTISNLGLNNLNIKGNYYTGGLVGYGYFLNMSNCFTGGVITGNRYVAMLIGQLADDDSYNNNIITNCYSNGTVSADNYVGGLIGKIDGTIVSNCYSNVDLTRSGTGTTLTAFIGVCRKSTIEKCYCTGDVNPSSIFTNAGFTAQTGDLTFAHNYWDNDASNQSDAQGATAKTTAEMKRATTFLDGSWSFVKSDAHWAMNGSDNSGYPFLRFEGYTPSQIWLGTSTTAWATTGNWSEEAEPASAENIIVPNVANDPIISGTTGTCNNMLLEPNAVLEVANDGKLTVNGNLTNNGTFTINSTAAGTGSLIVNGTATGSVTMQRYLAAATWTEWNDGWHFLSSPVASYPIQDNFTVTPDDEYDFYAWSEPDNKWINFKTSDTPSFPTVNGSNNFELGHGYLASYKTTSTKAFTGTINVSDIPISGLTITGSTNNNRSFHLLGNPFNSALTWYTGWTTSNIVGTAKIWNEVNQSYTTLSAGDAIPATNGFMVQATVDGASLTIPESKRVHSTTAFYKSSDYPIIKLKANNIDNPSAQESELRFNPESTNNWDMEFDSDFLPGFAPLFYSKIDDMPMAVNSTPYVSLITSIPFTFIKNEGVNFSIEMYEIQNMNMDVWLFDKKLNKDHNLTLNPIYVFTSFENDNSERFVIHFSPLGLEEETLVNNTIQAYANSNTLYILNPKMKRGIVTIYSLGGKEIAVFALTGDTKQQHSIATNSLINIVKIQTTDEVVSSKVVFQ